MKQFIKIDCSNPNKLQTVCKVSHFLGFNRKMIECKDEYFVTGGDKSKDLDIYQLENMQFIQRVKTHKFVSNQCYFIKNNKAFTFTDQEIILWDFSDIKNWNLLIRLKKNLKLITGANHNLEGLVIDEKIYILSEKLFMSFLMI